MRCGDRKYIVLNVVQFTATRQLSYLMKTLQQGTCMSCWGVEHINVCRICTLMVCEEMIKVTKNNYRSPMDDGSRCTYVTCEV